MAEDNEQPIKVYKSALSKMTDAQLDRVKARVKSLVGEDENFNLCLSVMITSQQLYALARYTLQQECKKEGIVWEDGVEETIIKASNEHSTKPISRTAVLESIQRTVLKFLTEEVGKQVEDERAEQMRANAEAHEKRMESTVTVLVDAPILQAHKVHTLERGGKSLIVHGYLKESQTAVANCVGPADFGSNSVGLTVLHLVPQPIRDKATPKEQTQKWVNVGSNRWTGLAASPSSFAKVLEPFVKRLHGDQCDVILVSNLELLADRNGLAGRSRVRMADNALRVLRRWAGEQGAVIVAALPMFDEDAPTWRKEIDEVMGEHNVIVEV